MDDNQDVIRRLWEIAGRFYDAKPESGLLGFAVPPFDLSRPNLHDNKSDFLQEKRIVDTSLASAMQLVDFLLASSFESQPDHMASKRVADFIDGQARAQLGERSLETVDDLILKSIGEVGISRATLFTLFEVAKQLRKRMQELINQEAIFWSGSSRPPNYYARTIALRFAKLLARETGRRPTFGTSRDGNHPSTEFGRALEEIFGLLGIKAGVRHPAMWAIAQLSEEDLRPEPANRLLSILAKKVAKPGARRNYLAEVAETCRKGGNR